MMNNKVNNVPKLRFKEFSGEWKLEKLGKFLKEYKEKILVSKNDIPVYSSSRNGLQPQKDYFDDYEIKNESSYGVVPKGYITYRHMSDDNVFKFNINNFLDNIAVSKEYPVFSAVNLNSYFLLYKLNFGKDFKKFAIQQKLGGTRTRLYYNRLCEWVTFFTSLKEQQKIAEFLSSVDNKLQALKQKHQLLQQYKKGMMQKLFTQQIRFKDENGQNYPEWKPSTLGNVTSLITNGLSLEQNSEQKGYKVTRIETISDGKVNINKVGYVLTEKEISNYKLDKGDMLFSNINSLSHIGKIAYVDKDYPLYHGMNLLRIVIDKKYSSLFYFYLLTANKYKRNFETIANQAVNQASINQTELKKTVVPISCIKEQQKIADFLSAIDQKIEGVTKQIEQTALFKKGLLQQLFV
ncbi:hypothetical protein GCM10023211_06090 [Orbus sasakiae]|uniref:Type I restriction modification DNA specificity domain-containing protein n=1 Tax=Orbus sasakiae TaxID=1078475 RepID=A0ABP9N0W5_9GAMM